VSARKKPGKKPVRAKITAKTLDSGDHIERKVLGEKLRNLRIRRRLNLGDVALGTGLSRSFIALIEAGNTDIAVSRLLRIAEFYGVQISDLVRSAGPLIETIAWKDSKRLPVGDEGVQFCLLSGELGHTLLPFMVRLRPHAAAEGISHSGDEFVHCIEGTVQLEVSDRIYTLRPGDTVTLPGRLPHSYRNPGNSESVLIGASAYRG